MFLTIKENEHEETLVRFQEHLHTSLSSSGFLLILLCHLWPQCRKLHCSKTASAFSTMHKNPAGARSSDLTYCVKCLLTTEAETHALLKGWRNAGVRKQRVKRER